MIVALGKVQINYTVNAVKENIDNRSSSGVASINSSCSEGDDEESEKEYNANTVNLPHKKKIPLLNNYSKQLSQ